MQKVISRSATLACLLQCLIMAQSVIAQPGPTPVPGGSIPVDETNLSSDDLILDGKRFFLNVELDKAATESKFYKCFIKIYERDSSPNGVRIDGKTGVGTNLTAELMMGTYDEPTVIKLSGEVSPVVPVGVPPVEVKVFATIHTIPKSGTGTNPTYVLSGNLLRKCVRQYLNSIPAPPGGRIPTPTLVDPCSEDPDDMTMTTP